MQETTQSGFWNQHVENKLVLMVEESGMKTNFVAGHVDTEQVKRWRPATVPDIGVLAIPMGVFK